MTAARQARVTEARRLHAAGLTIRAIADRMGVSYASASSYIHDPDLAKQRARRDRYGGRCRCGAKTDGSNGRSGTPERCYPCRKAFERSQQYWTRERIIDAIQRWAAEHGRPPNASDWLTSGPERTHPVVSNCYRNPATPNAPFATWNDAIAAAGFTPTPSGHYDHTPETRARRARERASA